MDMMKKSKPIIYDQQIIGRVKQVNYYKIKKC